MTGWLRSILGLFSSFTTFTERAYTLPKIKNSPNQFGRWSPPPIWAAFSLLKKCQNLFRQARRFLRIKIFLRPAVYATLILDPASLKGVDWSTQCLGSSMPLAKDYLLQSNQIGAIVWCQSSNWINMNGIPAFCKWFMNQVNTCFTDVGWIIEYWQNVIISYLGQSFSSNWTPKKFDTESCSASHCSNFRIGEVFLDIIVFPGF